jgi:hypothetical protein
MFLLSTGKDAEELFEAVREGDLKRVQRSIERVSKVDIVDELLNTPLHYAAVCGEGESNTIVFPFCY